MQKEVYFSNVSSSRGNKLFKVDNVKERLYVEVLNCLVSSGMYGSEEELLRGVIKFVEAFRKHSLKKVYEYGSGSDYDV